MTQHPERHYSLDEYFSIEEMSEVRHEYLGGEIFAMSGGSRNHEPQSDRPEPDKSIRLASEQGLPVVSDGRPFEDACRPLYLPGCDGDPRSGSPHR